jgi:hypothetical protein
MAGRTRAEWRQVILDDLGGVGTDPDLHESNLDSAIGRAMDLWNKFRPRLVWYPFDCPAAETTVTDFFAQPEHLDVENILAVEFSDRNRRILGPRAGFLEGYYLRWGYQGPRMFAQLHSGERTYERLTGARPDWKWDPASRRLFFSNPSRDVRAMVLASHERKVEEIRYDQRFDFRKLVVAAGKTLLAQILERRTGEGGAYPGPAGGIATDAAKLREEGEREWKEVEAKLETSLVSVPAPGYIG